MSYVMPDESGDHTRTWMGFPGDKSIWGSYLKGVQKNIALIAKTISKYEPVYVLISTQILSQILMQMIDEIPFEGKFEITHVIHPINDLWLRDSGPIFVNGGAVDFNFNGWGNKQKHHLDSEVAKFITEFTHNKRLTTYMVMEGGGIEVDGKGTAIITESCSLNNNRNPGSTKNDLEVELDRLLGIKKVIWLPGIKGYDITDGHTDFYARFVGPHRPGSVILHDDQSDPDTELNYNILKGSTDFEGNPISLIKIQSPDPKYVRRNLRRSKDAALGYVNFYICKGAVIIPEFGDEIADKNARDIIADCYPDRIIEQINIDWIALGGGGIHCCTQQEPLF